MTGGKWNLGLPPILEAIERLLEFEHKGVVVRAEGHFAPARSQLHREGRMTVWPLAVYFAAVLFIVVVMVGLSYVLGQRHTEPATGSQYESGIVSQGSAQARLSVKFFLVAAFFVVFDLETVFLFLWAVAGRELGWSGYIETLIFAGVLVAALIYLWRTGALDWYRHPRTRERP